MLNDKRSNARYPFTTDAQLTILPDGPTITVRTHDLSLRGLGLLSPIALEPGDRIRLRFDFRDEFAGLASEESVGDDLPVAVMFSRATLGGAQVGVSFGRPLTPAEQPLLFAMWRQALDGSLAAT